MAARAALADEGIAAAVVSLPCWELFAQQDDGYRARCWAARRASASRPRAASAGSAGWATDGMFIGMAGFGASAPAEDLYRHFGITPEADRRGGDEAAG